MTFNQAITAPDEMGIKGLTETNAVRAMLLCKFVAENGHSMSRGTRYHLLFSSPVVERQCYI